MPRFWGLRLPAEELRWWQRAARLDRSSRTIAAFVRTAVAERIQRLFPHLDPPMPDKRESDLDWAD